MLQKLKNNGTALCLALTLCLKPAIQKLQAADSVVTVTVPALVQISGLGDISFTASNFASPVTGATTACIYTNVLSPLGSYYLTASSFNGSGGAFRVKNGSNFIIYNAYWNANASPSPSLPLSSGVKTVQQSGGSDTSLSCSGTPNANFNIRISSSQVEAAPAAVYTDTVTLLVSPS